MKGRIGICLGDVTGVGPEVTLRALADEREADDWGYLLLGDPGWLDFVNQRLGTDLALEPFEGPAQRGRFCYWTPPPPALPLTLASGAPEACNAAVACLREGATRCLRGQLAALVTAPVNKEAIVRAGHAFVGQTELLSELAGTSRTAMMLLGEDDRGRWLRVVLATTHLPLKDVAHHLSRAKIELAIELAARACQALQLPNARVAVCGLNPHAGEGGKMGDEEVRVIRPAVEAMRKRGVEVSGPYAADALFHQVYRGDFDVVVAMYHDQGLAPLKMVAFENGVNWTLGLPFIRTSPDHGTAYDIAGRGRASPSSMRAALRLAKALLEPPVASP